MLCIFLLNNLVFLVLQFYSCLRMYCRWRSSYQEWRVGIQLSRMEGRDPAIKNGGLGFNRFNSTTFLCLSQTKTWISNVIYDGLFLFLFSELKREVIVRLIVIGGIVDYHCLSFLVLLILVELLTITA